MSVLSFVAVGLIFCILGATVIMRAFAFASFAEIAEKSLPQRQTVQSVMHTLCAQRVDARFGAPLLTLGFGLQLLSALGFAEKPVVMFLSLAAAAVALLYYGLMRDLIATQAASAVLAEKESVREMPKLIEAKVEAPMAASHVHLVEATAGA